MPREPVLSSEAPAPSGGYSQGIVAGGSLQDAVRVGMYISDMAHFDEMDAEYRRFFSEPRPARTTIQSDLVGFDVEGDAVVLLGD